VIEPDGAFIKIEQVRQLIGEVAYQPFEGRYRVAILDGAEQMRQEAANSLLKTLEEPPSRTVMVLVTASPYLLLTTIRSRCRLLQFGGIPEDRIEEYLVACEGWDRREAHVAAEQSQGSLSKALGFDPSARLEARDRAIRFLALLLMRGSFAEASRLIAAAAKDKDTFGVWLDSVRRELQSLYYAKTAPERAGLNDSPKEMKLLAEAVSAPEVASAIRAVDRLRRGLQFNLNRQIAAESLFLQVREARP
jgi:DNA polymerase-3 subunit delta'